MADWLDEVRGLTFPLFASCHCAAQQTLMQPCGTAQGFKLGNEVGGSDAVSMFCFSLRAGREVK